MVKKNQYALENLRVNETLNFSSYNRRITKD